MDVTFKFRRGPSYEWAADNPILRAGEPGYELDTRKLKIGDGHTAWLGLPYLTGSGGGGADGLSAYQIAVLNGFTGTEVEWLLSLVGPAGEDGTDGIQGPPGADGAQGVKGDKGDQGLQGDPGIPGTDGSDGAKGDKGDPGDDGAPGTPGTPGRDAPYAIAGYGAISSSVHPDTAQTTSSIGSFHLTRMLVPAGRILTSVGIFVTVGGSSPSASDEFLLYEETGALVGRSGGDATIFASNNTWSFRAFQSSVPAQSSDRFVYAGFVMPTPASVILPYTKLSPQQAMGGNGVANRRHIYSNDTTVATSLDFTSYGSTSAEYIPLIMLA